MKTQHLFHNQESDLKESEYKEPSMEVINLGEDDCVKASSWTDYHDLTDSDRPVA